jgi:hypothetical protein
MVSEEAFDDWKKQRTAERSAAKQKQQSPEKVRPHSPTPSLPPCPEPFSGVFLPLCLLKLSGWTARKIFVFSFSTFYFFLFFYCA